MTTHPLAASGTALDPSTDPAIAVSGLVRQWASGADVKAVVASPQIGRLRYAIVEHDGAHYLAVSEYGDDADLPTVRPGVRGPYATYDDARDDAWRGLTTHAVEHGLERRLSAYDDELVALLLDDDGYVVVSARRGAFSAERESEVLQAYGVYADQVRRLAEHVRTTADPTISNLAYEWLQRDAAAALLDQARTTLGVSLVGYAVASGRPDTSQPSVSEVARLLHTDRPNLLRAMKTAKADHPDIVRYLAEGVAPDGLR